METSLNVPPAFLEDVIPVVDSYLIDIKDMDPGIYSSYTGKDNSQVIANLALLAQKGLADRCVIRIPEIPGFNTQEDVESSETAVRSLGFQRIDKFKYDIDYATRKRNLQDAQGNPSADRP